MTDQLDVPTERLQAGQPGPGTADDAEAGEKVQQTFRTITILQRQGLVLLLLGLMAYMWRSSPYFLNLDNLLSIGGIAGALGVMAMVQTFLIVSGGLDISVGSVVSVTAVVLVKLSNGGTNIWLAVAVALAMGAAIGAVNGIIIIKLGVNPLITTLGTLSIFGGLAYMLNSSAAVLEDPTSAFLWLGSGGIWKIPAPFVIFLVVAALALVVERLTRFGRSVYAIGGNREAARLAGLRVDALPFFLYVLSGLSAGVGGVLMAAQLGAASGEIGETFQLSVVTAVVLGGASLAGGRGSVIGTFVAVLILGVLQNGFTLLRVGSSTQTMILGIALIVGVLLDQAAQKLRTRRAHA